MFQILLALLLSTMAFAQLTHESEISTITTGGNQNVETYLFKTLNQYSFDSKLTKFGGHYTYGEASEEVSARDWDVNGKYEQMVSPYYAIYFGEIIEGFRFQGIKARYNSDAGVKYYLIKSDLRNFVSEIGYRYTIEDRYSPSVNQFENKGRLFTEWNEKVSATFQYRLWAEYLPNFTNSDDYLFIYEASATAIMTSIFSLKVAYKGTYDDLPAVEGNKNYDYTYTTSLVAKF